MSDNVGYTPGSGATVAADNVGGVLYQRVKLALGADGAASDVSVTNPLPIEGEGELIEVLQSIRMMLNILVGSIGGAFANSDGELRVVTGVANVSNVAVSNITQGAITSVGTVTTLTQLMQFGSYNIENWFWGAMSDPAYKLRRNVSVS